MQYAKLTESNELILATPEDDITSGDWLEFIATEKPTETAIIKYSPRYDLISDMFGGERKIVQGWDQYIQEPVGRAGKLQGDSIRTPQHTETANDGSVICNAHRLPNSRLLDIGFYLIEETPYPQDGKQYRETGVLIDDPEFTKKIRVVWVEVIPEPEPPFAISKILLKKAMQSLGQWESFKALLQQDPDAYETFNMAVVLMSDDPELIQFRQVCMQMFGFTEQQITDMLKSCKSDIS